MNKSDPVDEQPMSLTEAFRLAKQLSRRQRQIYNLARRDGKTPQEALTIATAAV